MTAKDRALRVIVTGAGAEGELGHTLVYRTNEPDIAILGFSRKGMDAADPEHCRQVVKRYQPEVIIHCETETEAEAVAVQVSNVALAAKEFGAKLACVVEGEASEVEKVLSPILHRAYLVQLDPELAQNGDTYEALSAFLINLVQTDNYGFYRLSASGTSIYQAFKQRSAWR